MTFLEYKKEKDTWIAFDKNEWIKRMEYLADKPTIYRNEYPWNVLYYDGSTFWCDCK